MQNFSPTFLQDSPSLQAATEASTVVVEEGTTGSFPESKGGPHIC